MPRRNNDARASQSTDIDSKSLRPCLDCDAQTERNSMESGTFVRPVRACAPLKCGVSYGKSHGSTATNEKQSPNNGTRCRIHWCPNQNTTHSHTARRCGIVNSKVISHISAYQLIRLGRVATATAAATGRNVAESQKA